MSWSLINIRVIKYIYIIINFKIYGINQDARN